MSTGTALPPHLRARYGLDRRPVGTRLLIVTAVAAFVAALAWVGYAVLRPSVGSSLLAWDDVAADRVDITFEVQRRAGDEVYCVLRSQDEQRADVGYAVVRLPAGEPYVKTTYSLRTLAPAFVVELLGCAAGGPPERVPPPQFPPGIVAPEQPWTP